MPNPTRNLNTRVTIALVLYLVTTAVLLAGTLNGLLNRLAQTQVNELGNALSAQLTETLKQPVINDDIISTQVILDNLLADTPVIARATVYSTSNRILAQSQRPAPPSGITSPFVRPVNVDNNMIAQLRLELDQGMLFAQYRLPMWISVSLWLLLSLALGYYLVRLAGNYSHRISRLNSGFSDTPDNATAEIAQLEKSLSPFLAEKQEEGEADEAAPTNFALLAVSIPNLPKWQAQLNADHFTGILAKIDHLIDNHLSLFKGRRIHSRNTAMLLEFDQLDSEPPIDRALSCASALIELTGNLVSSQNIPFEMRITAASRRPPVKGSHWYDDLVREECVDRLLDMLPLAGSWELIIDKRDLESGTELAECELEDLSAASVWQFKNFSSQRQEKFYQQLEFLTATFK